MSSAQSSVLALKTQRAKRAPAKPSGLGEFASALETALADRIGALLGAGLEATTESAETTLPEALAEAENPGVYYWLLDGTGAQCVLAAIAPGFAAVAAERLLGGDLDAPAQAAEASLLEHELAGLVADRLGEAIDAALVKTVSERPAAQTLTGRRGARAPAEALAGVEDGPATAVTVNLAYDEKSAAAAIRLYFPAVFLSRAGLSNGTGNAAGSGETDADWRRRMRMALLHTQLPLAAVLGRTETSVGELSRLKVGQFFALRPDALDAIELTAQTSLGPAVIARARLGAMEAHKAVKLTTPIDPDFIRGL